MNNQSYRRIIGASLKLLVLSLVGGLIWLLLARRVGTPSLVFCVIIGVWLAAVAIDQIRTGLRSAGRQPEGAEGAVATLPGHMKAVSDKVNQQFTGDEWSELKRTIRAEGRKERIVQRGIFVVIGVLMVIVACRIWWEDDLSGWAGALWVGLIAALAFYAAITHGDDPKDY